MSPTNSNAAGGDGRHESSTTDRSGPRRALSTAVRFGRSGAAAVLAGGLLLVAAVRRARRTRRAGMLALTGCALLGIGLRQRRAGGPSAGGSGATGHDRSRSGYEETSAEVAAHREQSEVLRQSETNPRGVSGEPDVETETGADEGDTQFTTEQDEGAKAKPTLGEDEEEDPRRPEKEDPVTPADHVEVNLSESAMADEASEATGPDPEQAYPASEGTDPEPMAEKAPERRGEGAVANADSDGESDRPDGETAELTDDGEETDDDQTLGDEELA